ncbi:MAG: MlaD family protein [Nitrospiraceae bacterium]
MKMHYSHGMSSSRLAQVVGTFVVLPLLVLILAGVFMAKAEHLFEPKYHLQAVVSKSYGLEPGAPVLVSGIPVGRVQQVDFNEQGRVGITLQLRTRYQEMVREDSQARITKSGVIVGQAQVEIGMGDRMKPVLTEGADLTVVEPKDIADMINEVQPVLNAVKQTLLRVETITGELQNTLQTGGRALQQVELATRELPGLVSSVQQTVGAVERTAATLPDMTGSIKKTLRALDGITDNVKAGTDRLPQVIESAQQTMNKVQDLTSSVKQVTDGLEPILRTTQTTLDDVSTIVRGAKLTFPISRFVKNAETSPAPERTPGIGSLRGDQLSR